MTDENKKLFISYRRRSDLNINALLGEPTVSVMALRGMVGVGKSTLASAIATEFSSLSYHDFSTLGDVSFRAVTQLGELGKPAIPSLERILTHKSQSVRHQAFKYLTKLEWLPTSDKAQVLTICLLHQLQSDLDLDSSYSKELSRKGEINNLTTISIESYSKIYDSLLQDDIIALIQKVAQNPDTVYKDYLKPFTTPHLDHRIRAKNYNVNAIADFIYTWLGGDWEIIDVSKQIKALKSEKIQEQLQALDEIILSANRQTTRHVLALMKTTKDKEVKQLAFRASRVLSGGQKTLIKLLEEDNLTVQVGIARRLQTFKTNEANRAIEQWREKTKKLIQSS